MTTTARWMGVLLLPLAVLGGACSAESTGTPEDPGDEVDTSGDEVINGRFAHRWAIDMRKVREHMPSHASTSPRFVGVSPELLLPPAAAGGDPMRAAALENMRGRICERERIVAADGTTSEGGCYVYGLTQTRNYDHTRHAESRPGQRPTVNIIDESGNQIDPPGYLNVIALLNAERHEQTEIRRHLRNGDILVYFHPEDNDTTQSQTHHAAMYYDTGNGPLAISLNGVPFVHHVDNPVSYGPTFNAGRSSTPFHVFRFNPNGARRTAGRDDRGRYRFACTDAIRDASGPTECQRGASHFTISNDLVQQYAYMARNWALITNGHVPFSDFHTLTLRSVDQLDEYAGPALLRGQTPKLYCAGLAFTNLALAMNRPLGQRGLGTLYAGFASQTFEFNDRYMALGSESGAARGALTARDLRDTGDLPRLGRLPFEPMAGTDIVDSWLDAYFGGRAHDEGRGGLARPERAQVLAMAAPQIAAGFSQMRWAATKPQEELAARNEPVATPERIQQYAMAYAAGGDALAQFKIRERQVVDNRYVPPVIYHVQANREDSLLSYVGTVVHVDLLSPINGNTSGTGTGEVREFFEGGPDSSQYPHYRVPNGGSHVQRIIDVGSGPRQVGPGSTVSVRLSAADIRDVQVILHPAGSFERVASLDACDEAGRARTGTEVDTRCLGMTPARGIPLTIPATANQGRTVWNDVDVSVALFRPVSQGGAGCHVASDGRRLCPAYDWERNVSTPDGYELGDAYGQWTVTVRDLGSTTVGSSESPYCAECRTGGAHTNQWVLRIRNDRQ